MSERGRPFSTGSQYMDWQSSNCERCTKWSPDADTFDEVKCNIERAVGEGSIGDGTVSAEIAKRMGLPGNEDAYLWKCGEVEWTEEWKAEFLAKKERAK